MFQKITRGVCRWCKNHKCICHYLMIAVVTAVVFAGYRFLYCRYQMRFDQHAVTICTCIAGIVATMFGLTAASYAFIWGDLRTEAMENRHLQKILQQYREKLWKTFFHSLILTVVTIVFSLVLLMAAQYITKPSLYVMHRTEQGAPYAEYFNESNFLISLGTVFDFACAFLAVLIMAYMNYAIFQRKKTYDKIAEKCIQKICDRYCLDQISSSDSFPKRLDEKKQYPQEEFEKIHSLELIVDRIVENHASIGEAFEPDKLVSPVVI